MTDERAITYLQANTWEIPSCLAIPWRCEQWSDGHSSSVKIKGCVIVKGLYCCGLIDLLLIQKHVFSPRGRTHTT